MNEKKLTRDLNYPFHEATRQEMDAQWVIIDKLIGEKFHIPRGYEDFLRKYNGGAFEECIIKDSPIGELVVSEFYSLTNNENNSLKNIINFSEDDIKNGFLPIADDPGGNYYSISISRKNNDEIFYHLHDEVFKDGNSRKKIFSSFSNFINSLQPDE